MINPMLHALAIAGRKNLARNASAENVQIRRAERLGSKELFFLRTLPDGYDWQNADPDNLLPTAMAKKVYR